MTHSYSLFGHNIAVDTESGSVHLLSDAAFFMLPYLETLANTPGFSGFPGECPPEYEDPDRRGAYSELVGLYNEGLLFSAAEKIELEYTGIIKALCLNVAHDCNMACGYCFAGRGDYGQREKTLMSEDTGMAAVEFLMRSSGERRNLEVDFFGGEPLLNFETVKNIVKKTRILEKQYNKNVRFTLTTNGTLLNDEKIDFINEHIENIVLSLDGLPKTNDALRRYEDGGGVYFDIVPLYQKLISQRGTKSYYVRGTFTRKNLNFTKDVLHLAELGFQNISVEPVVLEESRELAVKSCDLPLVFDEYETLAREIIRRESGGPGSGFNFFHFNIDLENGPCVYKRSKGCGAGSEYLAVVPDGEIYPCHQFAGNKEFLLGNITDGLTEKNLQEDFFCNNIIRNASCRECWAKYFCGGGCAANNHNFNRDIREPYETACEMIKKRTECAIAIKAALSF
ncbi:MAG: thioether cross-link-forming SCIFF peptide maturase [Oscillospiraceae bacterium]|nr:thioether cross-link-forming SCIFF peptide maturase [Oscillospiraceae bacterium]